MNDVLFGELLEAAGEALAHHRGEKIDLRTTILPDPPQPMSRSAVKRLRERLGMSQSVFAHCLNVSLKLVQAWEGGTRTPEGPALKLLQFGRRYPALVFGVRVRGETSSQATNARARGGHRGRTKRASAVNRRA